MHKNYVLPPTYISKEIKITKMKDKRRKILTSIILNNLIPSFYLKLKQ